MDWTEKYRPQTLAEVRGNNKAKEAFEDWAQTWDDHKDTVILYGAPGVGKTSAAHALAGDFGWETIELNASNQRTASVIEQVAGEAAKSGTLTGGGSGRKLVILDEADNIHGNYDRGGSRAITEVVKDAEQPMVLIANDFYEMSNTLRNNCEDIEFRDIGARSIKPVLRDICNREGVEYKADAIDALSEKNSGDLRSAVNDLQALAETEDVLTEDDVVTGDRDKKEGVFDFLDDLMKTHDAKTAREASFSVDETPDSLINWIDDNMPKDYEGEELSQAYEFLSNSDKWLGRVQATQNYSYWKYAGDNMTAGVAAARNGKRSGWTRYGPPSYWRKLGSSKGTRKKRDYIAQKIAEKSGVSMGTARNDVIPFLSVMTHHCKNRELTVDMVVEYELSEDHVAFITGSGKDTNKVGSIVEDAEEQRSKLAVENSGGAFLERAVEESEKSETTDEGQADFTQAFGQDSEDSHSETDDAEGDDDSEKSVEERGQKASEDDSQVGLGDFAS